MRVQGQGWVELLNSSLKCSPKVPCRGGTRGRGHIYFVTTNCGLLLSVPAGVTTETVPVVAPFGTSHRGQKQVSVMTVEVGETVHGLCMDAHRQAGDDGEACEGYSKSERVWIRFHCKSPFQV